MTVISLLTCFFLIIVGHVQPTSPANTHSLPQKKDLKKKRIVGSAWREATQHVYIRSTGNIANSVTPSAYISPNLPPEPPIQKAMEPSFMPAELPQNQMHIKEPSPEEMRLFFSQLEEILNSPDDDDDDYDGGFAALLDALPPIK